MPELMQSPGAIKVAKGGIDVIFKAGEPRMVRDSMVKLCQAMGASIVGGEDAASNKQPEPTFDDEAIADAIRLLLDDGDKSAFGNDGKPKVKPIEKLLGGNISAEDRDRVWGALDNDNQG